MRCAEILMVEISSNMQDKLCLQHTADDDDDDAQTEQR